MAPRPSQLEYHYIKSNLFRVVYAEGAYGGVNSRGTITCTFYNERSAIPKTTKIPVTIADDGLVTVTGAEEPTGSRNGIVRELEVEVAFNLETAISFREWLDDKIKNIQKYQPKP